MRQQVLNRDRAFRRDYLAIGPFSGNRGFCEGRNEMTNGFIQTDLSFLYQSENRCARNGFGLRCNPEDRVGVIRRPASLSLQPTARSYAGLPSRSTSATAPAILF